MYTCMCMHIKTTNLKRGNNLKENGAGYMEGFGERNQKRDMYLYYYLKNKSEENKINQRSQNVIQLVFEAFSCSSSC